MTESALRRFYGQRGYPSRARVKSIPEREEFFFHLRAPGAPRGGGPQVVRPDWPHGQRSFANGMSWFGSVSV